MCLVVVVIIIELKCDFYLYFNVLTFVALVQLEDL